MFSSTIFFFFFFFFGLSFAPIFDCSQQENEDNEKLDSATAEKEEQTEEPNTEGGDVSAERDLMDTAPEEGKSLEKLCLTMMPVAPWSPWGTFTCSLLRAFCLLSWGFKVLSLD